MDYQFFTACGKIACDLALARTSSNGTPVVNGSLANHRMFRVKGGPKGVKTEKTNFFYFTAWGDVATNLVARLKKGDWAMLSGRLETEEDHELGRQVIVARWTVDKFQDFPGTSNVDPEMMSRFQGWMAEQGMS